MRRAIDDLKTEVAALGGLDRDALVALWQKAHGQNPPKAIRSDLLIRSAAWQLQATRLGGLSASTRRLLKQAMTDAEKTSVTRAQNHVEHGDDALGHYGLSDHTDRPLAGEQDSTPGVKRSRAVPSPGARLVREWNGKNHVVDVIEGGFVFQAKVHKSLTAIAHQITGAHWSGPRFFGL